jgi:hypothetical protein
MRKIGRRPHALPGLLASPKKIFDHTSIPCGPSARAAVY